MPLMIYPVRRDRILTFADIVLKAKADELRDPGATDIQWFELATLRIRRKRARKRRFWDRAPWVKAN